MYERSGKRADRQASRKACGRTDGWARGPAELHAEMKRVKRRNGKTHEYFILRGIEYPCVPKCRHCGEHVGSYVWQISLRMFNTVQCVHGGCVHCNGHVICNGRVGIVISIIINIIAQWTLTEPNPESVSCGCQYRCPRGRPKRERHIWT